jgi:dTDP-4-amino-4,6-dideoxy-D-galactose acyltransferase
MKKLIIEQLSWDTEFFGFPVGKIIIVKPSSEHCSLSALSHKISGFRVCYVFSPIELHNDVEAFQDEKVIFELSISHTSRDKNSNIKSATLHDFDDLVTLALASGEFSRFRLDPNFRTEFTRLYSEWLLRCLKQEMADDVLVYHLQGAIAGFITWKKKTGYAEIGLIAIDERFRGQGIGTSLMNAVLCFALHQECQAVRVATQRRNREAINFYIKNGYREVENTFIYHLWK